MAFSVRVPVLSAHTTSTRARPSMAGNSLTRHLRRPSRMTPSAKAVEVMSTSPSGIMGTSAPETARMISRHPSAPTRICPTIVRTPTGTSTHVMALRIQSMPACSSECTSENFAASAVSWAA